MPIIKIAVMSDLHCRLQGDPNDSLLTVGALRVPATINPVASLKALIDTEHLSADLLVNPGDFTNKARQEGLAEGWMLSQEIGRKLQVDSVIPVIGNHDIISRREGAQFPVFHFVQNLDVDFPFAEQSKNSAFFGDGFCVIRRAPVEIIAINTVIEQTDEASANRGTFSQERIARLESQLDGTLTEPIRIALMHHHPILHSGISMGDNDVLEHGDMLLSALRRLGCKFVIHGHKHEPRLTHVNGMTVLASGSLSANLQQFGSSFANTFHLITIESDGHSDPKGTIKTWAFHYGHGWKKAGVYCGLPHITGFGNTIPIPTMSQALLGLASSPSYRFSAQEVRTACPSIDLLTPAERESLESLLETNGLSLSASRIGETELLKEYTA